MRLHYYLTQKKVLALGGDMWRWYGIKAPIVLANRFAMYAWCLLFRANKKFTLEDRKYAYAVNLQNTTFRIERAVEIPVALQVRLAERGVRPGYLLGVVSRIIQRKNPGAYLESFRRLPAALRRERKLVLAGGARALEDFRPFVGEETLRAVRDDVVIMGRVSDDDLARLYTLAGASLFLSNYEGFGLPVIEALACGTEVIAADIPAIREAASSSTFLFRPDDVEGVARCTEMVLAAPEAERNARRATGAAWVQRFSYAAYAETLSGLLGRIMA